MTLIIIAILILGLLAISLVRMPLSTGMLALLEFAVLVVALIVEVHTLAWIVLGLMLLETIVLAGGALADIGIMIRRRQFRLQSLSDTVILIVCIFAVVSCSKLFVTNLQLVQDISRTALLPIMSTHSVETLVCALCFCWAAQFCLILAQTKYFGNKYKTAVHTHNESQKSSADASTINANSFNYIIVCGAALIHNQPSALLKRRLDTALAFWRNENTDSSFILSGGKRPSQAFSEAEVMESYLLSKDINHELLICEDKSLSTVDNFRNTRALIEDLSGTQYTCAFVSSDFHIARSLHIAQQEGLVAHAVASITPWLSLPHALMRELLASIVHYPSATLLTFGSCVLGTLVGWA